MNKKLTIKNAVSRRDFIKKSAAAGIVLSATNMALGNSEGSEGKPAKKIHIIYGESTHNKACHNNVEVASLIKFKLDQSKYKESFDVTTSFKYPEDESLIQNADLVIISSDGAIKHALTPNDKKVDISTDMKKLDSVIEKNKTGLIVIHWATDAPSRKYGAPEEENDKIMMDWIGACYYWVKKSRAPESSWTKKPGVEELKVNQKTVLSNGLPEKFKMQDEYYYNFFTDGVNNKRNVVSDKVQPVHLCEMGKKGNAVRLQPVYWGYTRANEGRSVGMTSAHFYHNWANPNFFKTFMNSIFWTLGMEVPKDGVDIATPTIDELLAQSKDVEIDKKAQHFS